MGGVWRAARAEDGSVYFYNVITNETQWDRPEGEIVDEDNAAIYGAHLEQDVGCFSDEEEELVSPKRQRVNSNEMLHDVMNDNEASAPSTSMGSMDKRGAFNAFLATPDSNGVKASLLLSLILFGTELQRKVKEKEKEKYQRETTFAFQHVVSSQGARRILTDKLIERIRERFNVSVTDELLKRFDIHVPPPWLKELLQEESARRLLTSLFEEYPRSQFLKYCKDKMNSNC